MSLMDYFLSALILVFTVISLVSLKIYILLSVLIPVFTITCFLHNYQKTKSTASKMKCTLPQASGAWPVIGHYYLFGGRKLAHEVMGAMADKHGPAFALKLGSKRGLVVSSWEMAKEIFTVHDKIFSDRPRDAAIELLSFESTMFSLCPHGPYWREARKITTANLLSTRTIESTKHRRASEVENAMKELYQLWMKANKQSAGVMVEMKEWFRDLTLNMGLKMVAGKTYFGANAVVGEAEARNLQQMTKNFFHLLAVFVLSDCFPFLWWWDHKGYKKLMKTTVNELEKFMQGCLHEHKQKRQLLGGNHIKDEPDLIDILLNTLDDVDNIAGTNVESMIKSTCVNMLVSAADATSVTLTWALALLLNNSQVLEKAQQELDAKVGKERLVNESDIGDLAYLQAIVKETLRLYPPSTVIGVRSSTEDCTLSAGYQVPAGTSLFLNVWKIQRDERIWPNPHMFYPERFLTTHKKIDLNLKGQNYELLPFGAGRRSCPGMSLGLRMVHLTLASLLQAFEVAKVSKEHVDMTRTPGRLTSSKEIPLPVFLTPRLAATLYGQ